MFANASEAPKETRTCLRNGSSGATESAYEDGLFDGSSGGRRLGASSLLVLARTGAARFKVTVQRRRCVAVSQT
jgi:hypothetical protein